MNKVKIQDPAKDIVDKVQGKAREAGKLVESNTSASKTILESQLDTFSELTNIAVEGAEKMVELNMDALKDAVDDSIVVANDLLAPIVNDDDKKMNSATKHAVHVTQAHVAKASDQVTEAVKKAIKK